MKPNKNTTYSSLSTFLALVVMIGWGFPQRLEAEVTGQWDFKEGDLRATIGHDMEYFDGPGGATELATQFGTTADFGLPAVAGEMARVIRVPKNTPQMGLKLFPDLPAGGGTFANQYSLVIDLYYPAGSANRDRALLQIDDPYTNLTPAELLINASNAIGVAGQFHGEIKAETWHRVAVTVDLEAEEPLMRKYIDGVLVGSQVLPGGVDSRWAIEPRDWVGALLLFTDQGANSEEVYVGSIQVHDMALRLPYIAALGGPTAGGIPLSVTPVLAIERKAPEAGATLVLPNTPIIVDIAEAADPIEPGSIEFVFNGIAVNPQITRPEEGLLRIQYDPGLLSPFALHTASLSFTDPSDGSPVSTGEWSFRLAPYHLAGEPIAGALVSLSMDENEVMAGSAIADGSEHGNNGVFRTEGFGNKSVPGVIGNAILFGPDELEYIEMSQPWAGTPNSFSAWVKISPEVPDGTRAGVVAGNYPDAGNVVWEIHASGRPRIWWNGGSPDWIIDGFDLRTDQWEHIAFVRDPAGNQITFYWNGIPSAVLHNPGASVTPVTSSFVGADKRGPATPRFRGAIDELMIHERPLQPEEVWLLYGRAFDFPEWAGNTPEIASLAPEPGATGVSRRPMIAVVIDQNFSPAELEPGSTELKLNGSPVAPVVTEESGRWTVQYELETPLEAAVSHTVEIRFEDKASPPNVTVREWSFATAPAPAIVAGPQDRTVFSGRNYQFSVRVEASPPVTYQWRHNGIDMPEATDAFLILRDIQRSDAGVYSVVVSDAGGSDESEPAVLTVVPLPLDSLITLSSGPLPDPDPLFYMPMDEETVTASSHISDLSQHANHGLFQTPSAEDKSIPGAIGRAIGFGPDELEFVEISQPWGGTPNSFSAWVKVSPEVPDGTRVGVVAGNYPDSNNVAWEVHTSGRPRIWWNNGSPNWIIDGFDLRTGQWEHIAFVRHAAENQVTFFWNGVVAAVHTGAGAEVTPASASYIGADKRGPATPRFRGAIDEVVVYERPLLSEEVWQLYSRQIALPDGIIFDSPRVWALSPVPGETGAALDGVIEAIVNDSFSQTDVDPSSIQLLLNGAAVSDLSIQYDEGFYTIRHVPPVPLAAGAEHLVEIRFQDTAAANISEDWQFTTAAGAPVVTTAPRSQTVVEETDLVLWVEAETVPPASYQWYRNGQPIAGATSGALELRAVTRGQSGLYSVHISDAGGSVETSPAVLTVVDSLPEPAEESLGIGLTAHWTFDVDFSSEIPGFDGVPFNNPTIASPARIGPGAGQFVQANQSHVRVNRPVFVDGTLEYSVAGWFNLAGGTGRRSLLETAPANWALAIEINTGGALVYWHRDATSGSRSHNTGIEPVVGQWYHVAVVFNGREGFSRIYVDGQEAGSIEHPIGVGTASSSAFHIGTFRGGDARFFEGEIDDLGVWNRTLTGDEIAYLATGNEIPEPVVSEFEPLAITAQPGGQMVPAGGQATFTVEAVGTPPFSFQWRRNGTDIEGATSAMLQISNVQVGHAGTYSVLVQDAFGSLESQGALLTVLEDVPSPAESLRAGLRAHWSFDEDFNSSPAGFEGTPFGAAAISTDARVGAGAASFIQSGQSYVHIGERVIEDGALGYSISGWFKVTGGSERRTLWDTPPANWAIAAEVTAGGTLAYFIRDANLTNNNLDTGVAVPLNEWHHIAVIFDATIGHSEIFFNGQSLGQLQHPVNVGTASTAGLNIGTFRGADARFFEGLIDEVGVWSRPLNAQEIAYLAAGNEISAPILEAPDIVQQPQDQSVLAGGTAYFRVTTTGTAPLLYQWQLNGEPIEGATGPVLWVTDVAQAGAYRVVVSNQVDSVQSQPAEVTILDALPPAPQQSLLVGLRAHWSFDEDFASTKPGFDGLPVNGAIISSEARIGMGAARFVQADQHFVTVDQQVIPDGAMGYSVAAWFKLKGGTGRRSLWETFPANWAISTEVNAAGVLERFIRQADNSSHNAVTDVTPALDEWHHVVVMFDAATGTADTYIDGVQVDADMDPPLVQGLGTAPTAGFRIGTFRGGTARFFEGLIDDAAVWNRQLTTEEIAWLAAGNPVVPMEAHLRFTAVHLEADGIRLDWEGGNPPYRVQFRPNLVEGEWIDLADPVSDSTFLAPRPDPTGFYRVIGN